MSEIENQLASALRRRWAEDHARHPEPYDDDLEQAFWLGMVDVVKATLGHRLTSPPPQREFRLVLTGPGERPEPSKGDRIDVGGNLFDVLDVTKAPEDSPDAGTVTLDLKAGQAR